MTVDLPLERRVERFLQGLEKPIPFAERCAHAIANQPELIEVCRELLQVLAGQGEAHMTLARKATRLCVALRPLLMPSRAGGKHLIDEYVQGTVPGLEKCVNDVLAELEGR